MSTDALAMLLRSFTLSTMATLYPEILASAEEHNWGYRKFLTQLCEAEAAERKERKRNRLLKKSGLPAGKTFGTLDEAKLLCRATLPRGNGCPKCRDSRGTRFNSEVANRLCCPPLEASQRPGKGLSRWSAGTSNTLTAHSPFKS